MNRLRSERSDPLYLRFYNCYTKSVDVIWINLMGQRHIYRTLKPTDFVDVNTFTKHYWAFEETQSRVSLVGNNRRIFCGEENGCEPYRSNVGRRYIVVISRPIVSKLRTICIESLSYGNNALRQCSDVKHLEIPVTLKKEIIQKIHKRDLQSHVTPADFARCENNLISWAD